ncbi:MAG: IclR family transcriptional regulator [Chloroflexota bacterium]|nr:IclR family transcriptional regulator [Chloroflexota bacterium]
MSISTSVKTVDRLVEIIDSFSSSEPAWTLTDLSRRLDVPKSTLHRFLVSLEAHGILRQDEESKRWCLGCRLLVWGKLAEKSTPLHHIARPVMEDLVSDTGETALLTVYASREVICVEKAETSHPVRLALDAGSRRPPHAGASSKILMAHLPEGEVEAIIREQGLPRLCVNTITDAEELRKELARIREQGYARSYQETDQGAWGIATPIRDWQGEVVAAIGIAGPTSRFGEEVAEGYVDRCRQAADRISSSLLAGALSDDEVTASGQGERHTHVTPDVMGEET